MYVKCTSTADACVDRYWPASVEVSDSLDASMNTIHSTLRSLQSEVGLGKEHLSLERLASNPGPYLSLLYLIMVTYDSCSNGEDKVETEATNAWARDLAYQHPEYDGLTKSQKSRLVRKIVAAVNRGTPLICDAISGEPHASFRTYLLESIEKAKVAIANSKLYLQDIPYPIPLEPCFTPNVFRQQHRQRKFAIMPLLSFRRKFVEVDVQTLATLMKGSRVLTGQGNNQATQGKFGEFFENMAKFLKVFDFSKIGKPDRYMVSHA
jgi:hypothetical protein